jgi:hypothetical protein
MTDTEMPARTVRMLSDAGTEVEFTALDDRSDEQALVDAGAFASRMGSVQPKFVSITTEMS